MSFAFIETTSIEAGVGVPNKRPVEIYSMANSKYCHKSQRTEAIMQNRDQTEEEVGNQIQVKIDSDICFHEILVLCGAFPVSMAPVFLSKNKSISIMANAKFIVIPFLYVK